MININSKEMKIIVKILGIVCLLMAALIYGEYMFVKGRQVQCFKSGGFLIGSINNEPLCQPKEILEEKGWKILSYKKLTYMNIYPDSNSLNITYIK